MLRGTRTAEAHLRRFHRRAGTFIRNWTLAIYVICWPRIWLRSVHVLWTWVKFKVEFKNYAFIWRRDFRWCSVGSSSCQRNQHYWRRTSCVAPGQQGGLGGKTTPNRACPCKDPNSLKGRTPTLKIFYTSDSFCQNTASLAPAIGVTIQREGMRKTLGRMGWHLCEEAKPSQKSP